ncbi:6-phosphofructokinase [Arthrobacter sp. B2a2-09]|nr:6-phosphofructokinase [Arthrobacter sp. B2a2-09]MCZ9885081.1 6-phosphofructokinase [Arthrobacter sp. B2a2-09]
MPRTIDNGLAATDSSFGFDAAVEIAAEAVDRIGISPALHRCPTASKGPRLGEHRRSQPQAKDRSRSTL